jgi:hypothetical protein
VSSVEHAVALKQFMQLFRGYETAYGTGIGGWVHEPPTIEVFAAHVAGRGAGLGIGPLLPDGTCYFGAIDLDRPDLELAKELMKLLPGVCWLERSRSGNAHVLVFFSEPIEAWVVRGILRETLAAVGEESVEVFPKNDQLAPGSVGSYLNLPYFGNTRPVLARCANGKVYWFPHALRGDQDVATQPGVPFGEFVRVATQSLNASAEWCKRASWLAIPSPKEREQSGVRDFGTSPQLHRCAEYIIRNRDSNPVTVGHRASVFFSLAKQLMNWSECDNEEALELMELVNDASPDPITRSELRRILSNVERGEFRSTGCDDPTVIPFSDPECPIVKRQ